MSLDFLQEQIDGFRGKAADLLDGYSRTQAEVAADPNLTDAGKHEALAPLHDEVSTKVRALLSEEKAAVKRKREALEKTVFGITATSSGDVVSYRDAQDRAARLTDREEAQTAYTNALRSDDKVLAQAILAQALTRGWSQITNDYVDRNPSAGAAIDDLHEIGRYENNSFESVVKYMVPALDTAPTLPVPTISSSQIADWFTNGGKR